MITRSILGRLSSFHNLLESKELAVKMSCFDCSLAPADESESNFSWLSNFFMRSVAMSAYFCCNSMPMPLRLVLWQATKVEPVPKNGSNTIWPCLVKNLMNSAIIFSGYFAG